MGKRQAPLIIDPQRTVDYSKNETPPNYRCFKCDATGCKLWRESQVLLGHRTLLCARCVAEDQGEDISDIDAWGSRSTDLGRTDQISWYVPAVPAAGNNSYWHYTFVPDAGCKWWKNLPTFPLAQSKEEVDDGKD